jgi:hypothetical protein
MDGSASAGEIGLAIGWAAALTAVFAPLTLHLYRSRA